MADINTRRFTSTVANGTTGTTFVSTDGNFQATDVGRCIVISSADSPAFGQIRKITSFTNATTVTIDYDWNTSPFQGERAADGSLIDAVTEVLPEMGDSFIVSINWSEIATDNADVELVSNTNRYFRLTGVTTLTDGTFIYDNNMTLEANWATQFMTTTGTTGFSVMRLGDISPGTNSTSNGYSSNPCKVIDTSTTLQAAGSTYNAHFHFYGTQWTSTATGTTPTFIRMNAVSSSSQSNAERAAVEAVIIRMYQCQFVGNFGSRISGSKSVLLDIDVTNARGSVGWTNPVGVGLLKNINVRDAIQAVYHFPQFAGNADVFGLTVDDLRNPPQTGFTSTTGRLMRVNTNGAPANNRLNFIDLDIDALNALENSLGDDFHFAFINGSTNLDTFRTTIFQNFRVNLQDTNLADFTNSTRLVIEDNDGNLVTTTDVTDGIFTTSDGSFDTLRLEYGRNENDFTLVSGVGRFIDLSQFSTVAPYRFHLYSDMHNLIGQIDNLTTPGVNSTFTMTLDGSRVVNDATAAAYTELETAEKIYDYQYTYKTANLQLPSIRDIFFTRSGNVLTASTGFNVNFNNSATDIFAFGTVGDVSTLNIRDDSDGYNGGLILQDGYNAVIHDTIRGQFDVDEVVHSFSDGDTIVDTEASQNYTINLAPGTYTINRADVTNLVVNRTGSSGNVIVNVIGGTGVSAANTASGTGVTVQEPPVTRTVNCAALTTGTDVFVSDGTSEHTFTISNTVASFTVTSNDSGDIENSNISTGNVDLEIWISGASGRVPAQRTQIRVSGTGTTILATPVNEAANIDSTATVRGTLGVQNIGSTVTGINVTGFEVTETQDLRSQADTVRSLLAARDGDDYIASRRAINTLPTYSSGNDGIWFKYDPFLPIGGVTVRLDIASTQFTNRTPTGGETTVGKQMLTGVVPSRINNAGEFIPESNTSYINSSDEGDYQRAQAIPPAVGVTRSDIDSVNFNIDGVYDGLRGAFNGLGGRFSTSGDTNFPEGG